MEFYRWLELEKIVENIKIQVMGNMNFMELYATSSKLTKKSQPSKSNMFSLLKKTQFHSLLFSSIY